MSPLRLTLVAVLCGALLGGCSRGAQGDPQDAVPVRHLIERLDDVSERLKALFELRQEVERARAQLEASQRELADDFPEIKAAGGIDGADLPDAAQGRVRAFRAGVHEYDRLVARHNALAKDLGAILDGRSPDDVHKLLRATNALRNQLSDMLKDHNYTRAVYVAQHAKLVHALGLQSP